MSANDSTISPNDPHINDADPLWAVVPAAGSGSRLPSNYPKQYLQLNGKSILQRTIETLLQVETLAGVVVVLAENDQLWNELPASKHAKVLTTIGGATRAESVVAGLNMVCEKANDTNAMVLVHDAARALTALSDIQRLIEKVSASAEQGGLLATKVQDTLKRGAEQASNAGATIGQTVNRDGLWHAQTPQMFRANDLREALTSQYAAVTSGEITDECCAMEHSGCSPLLVEALKPNFKITRSNDLEMALAMVEYLEREPAK